MKAFFCIICIGCTQTNEIIGEIICHTENIKVFILEKVGLQKE